jgi:hypothetical protein
MGGPKNVANMERKSRNKPKEEQIGEEGKWCGEAGIGGRVFSVLVLRTFVLTP